MTPAELRKLADRVFEFDVDDSIVEKALRQAAADLETLTRERDEAEARTSKYGGQLLDQVEKVERERDQARAQVEILAKALRTYAKCNDGTAHVAREALKAAGVEETK